jgi:hypothetical protein
VDCLHLTDKYEPSNSWAYLIFSFPTFPSYMMTSLVPFGHILVYIYSFCHKVYLCRLTLVSYFLVGQNPTSATKSVLDVDIKGPPVDIQSSVASSTLSHSGLSLSLSPPPPPLHFLLSAGSLFVLHYIAYFFSFRSELIFHVTFMKWKLKNASVAY